MGYPLQYSWASLVAQTVKNLSAMRGDLGSIPGSERIRLRFRRHRRHKFIRKILWRRAWQPTPVFLPGESPWTEEPGGLQAMGHTELDTTERLSTAQACYYRGYLLKLCF